LSEELSARPKRVLGEFKGLSPMDLLMEANWTGHSNYEISAGIIRPLPQMDFTLPDHLLRELTDSFTFFDRNGDGHICKAELGAVLRSLGETPVTDADLETLMHDVDVNGDGCLDFYEFIQLNTRAMQLQECGLESCSQPSSASDDWLSAFRVFDVDRNGFISAEELHRVLVGLGDEGISVEECRGMIQCVDEDGDHMVDFREFQALMTGAGSRISVH